MQKPMAQKRAAGAMATMTTHLGSERILPRDRTALRAAWHERY
jgi:hypothetical protein